MCNARCFFAEWIVAGFAADWACMEVEASQYRLRVVLRFLPKEFQELRMHFYRLLGLTWLALFLAVCLPAQTRTIAERLGYPAYSKLLIIHADDLAVAHSVDSASFAA